MMLKREWGAESNGKLPHLSIPRKIAAWVPEFAVEDLPLRRIAALVPEFAVKDLPLGRILMMMMMINNKVEVIIINLRDIFKTKSILLKTIHGDIFVRKEKNEL